MAQSETEKIPLSKLLEAITPYQAGIYVTVLNIIQCIALAFLINEVREATTKGELCLVLVVRSAVALTIILVIWHRYVCESQYLWPMSWWDTIIPFSMGICECAIVFSASAKVPLFWFLLFIAFVEVLGAFAYWHAYAKRSLDITKKLYQSSYADYPRFVLYLSEFLIDYDLRNMVRFVALCLLSFVFVALVWIHNFFAYELVFPMFYVFELFRGEISDSFHRAMMSDLFLSHYFEEEEQ
ncbi:MAG: hypothetical protein Q8Q48_03740 [Candidatus Staskawiczbacteria bacterium]|nr:hypothetical protein [Candidatus Staskawiczbacteria bacterium]